MVRLHRGDSHNMCEIEGSPGVRAKRERKIDLGNVENATIKTSDRSATENQPTERQAEEEDLNRKVSFLVLVRSSRSKRQPSGPFW